MNRQRLTVAAAGLAGVAGLAGLGLAGTRFLAYRAAGPDLTAIHLKPIVAIDSPAPGAPVQSHGAIQVRVGAVARGRPIASLGLWIDGLHVGAEPARPSDGESPQASFELAVGQLGPHVLIASAIDESGATTYSAPVTIDVVTNTGAVHAPFFTDQPGGIVLASGQVPLPALPESPPPESAPPGSPWQGTFSAWLRGPSLTDSVPPPELAVEPGDCQVRLWIHDRSSAEHGFVIYRLHPTASAWARVATLAPHPGDGWFVHTDTFDDLPETPGGAIAYFVETFDSRATAASPPVQTALNPIAKCAPSPETSQGLTVEFTGLVFSQPFDRAYCYRSYDGVQWHRWPTSGFLTPTGGGEAALGQEAVRFLMQDLDSTPVDAAPDLALQCWGWHGSSLLPLGGLAPQEIDPDRVGPLSLAGNGIDLSLLQHGPGAGRLAPQAAAIVPDLALGWQDFSSETLPYYHADITFDPGMCRDHLRGASDFHEYRNACSPLSGFHEGPGGVAPQPYLIWNVQDGVCPAGAGIRCIPWQSWLQAWAQKALKFGGTQTAWYITDSHGPDTWLPDNPFRNAYAIPPTQGECTNGRMFSVRLHLDTIVGDFYGIRAYEWRPCSSFEPFGDGVVAEIVFTTLTLSDVSDGLNSTADVYGNLEVYTDNLGADPNLWNAQAISYGGKTWYSVGFLDLGGDHFRPASIDGSPADPVSLPNGAHDLRGLAFAVRSGSGNLIRAAAVNNNRLAWPIVGGESLLIRAGLLDDDPPGNGSDRVCVAFAPFGPIVLSDFVASDGIPATLAMPKGSGDAAGCSLSVIVRPVED